MMSKAGSVPRLRFPEFSDAGDWTDKRLGDTDVSIFVNDRMPREELRLENYVSTVNLLPDFTGVTTATKLPPTSSATKFAKDDILISNIRPYLKKICLSSQDGSASNDVIVVRARETVSSQFLSFLLMNDRFVDYVMVGAKGVKMPRGDISRMKEYPLTIPKPNEQQKIAACLASVDDLLTAEAQKLEALKDHKKGLMLQLFPREGETKPRLRFPEFSDAGGWENRRLGDVGKFIGGGTPDTSIPEYWNGEIQWFTPTEIKQKYLSESNRGITQKGLDNSSAKILPKGTLLISTRATVGDIGISENLCATNQGFQSLCVYESEANEFWYYWLLRNKNELVRRSSGSTFLEIGRSEIAKVDIRHPEKPEQQKIADCLTSVDDLITAQAQKLEALKDHKKGLMQQLFPASDEVSG